MFNILSTNMHSKDIIKSFDTFDEARKYAENEMKAVFFMVDEQYPDCADFIAGNCCYCVEPESFKLAS